MQVGQGRGETLGVVGCLCLLVAVCVACVSAFCEGMHLVSE